MIQANDFSGMTPIYGSTSPYADNMNEIIGWQLPDPNNPPPAPEGRTGHWVFSPDVITWIDDNDPKNIPQNASEKTPSLNPDSAMVIPSYPPNPQIPPYDGGVILTPYDGCDIKVRCADGTTESGCNQTFAPLCTGHGGVYNPQIPPYDGVEGSPCGWGYSPDNMGYRECAQGYTCQSDPNVDDAAYCVKSVSNDNYTPDGGACGGNRRPPLDPCNPNSTCYYEDVCSPLSDRAGICTPNSQIPADYEYRMANRDCSIKYFQCDDGTYAKDESYCPSNNLQVEPAIYPAVGTSDGFINTSGADEWVTDYNSTGYMKNDPILGGSYFAPQQNVPEQGTNPATQVGITNPFQQSVYDTFTGINAPISTTSNPCEGVRCKSIYKPCPEGYIDGNPCCPNTGNCVPDPDYVATDAPVLPVGNTPSTQFGTQNSTRPTRGSSPNTRNYATQTDQPVLPDETPTEEKPKEGGIGILALGLIALKLLAT